MINIKSTEMKTRPATAVELKDVSKRYTLYPNTISQLLDMLGLYRWLPKTPFTEHVALNDFNLEIKKGERVGIIGRNGSGKTTLLKLITQSTQPSAGQIKVNGSVQALMQVGLGFHPEFTGRQNIKASLLYSGLNEADKERAESEIINFCELGEYVDLPLKTYSLGMQSRLQFACATAIKPEILVIDEILGAGDAYFSVKSSQRIERLTHSGCTLLLVSHSMAQVLQFCERVIWIQNGRIRADGNARTVVGEYESYMSFEAAKLGTEQDIIGFARRSADALDFNLQDQSTNDAQGYVLATFQNDDKGFRWHSEDGPKLKYLDIFANGQKTRTMPEGSEVVFRGTVQANSSTAPERPVVFTISIFNADNLRLTRITSDAISFGERDEVLFSLKLKPFRLLAERYYINFAIFEMEASGSMGCRFDLVTKFCDFEVVSILRYTEDGLFVHDAEWTWE
jgi:ABC-type polysaccharide/polyol phosphate transport system ATPase subunit